MKNKNKRLILRNWVQCVLFIINIVMLLIMASDMVDTGMFIVSHISAGIIFMFNSYILLKYSKLIEE